MDFSPSELEEAEELEADWEKLDEEDEELKSDDLQPLAKKTMRLLTGEISACAFVLFASKNNQKSQRNQKNQLRNSIHQKSLI